MPLLNPICDDLEMKNPQPHDCGASSFDSESPAMRVTPVVMPVTATVTEVHVRSRRVIDRCLIHHHRRRRGHINYTRCAYRCRWRAVTWRGSVTGIRHGIARRLAVNGVCDHHAGGDTGQNFSDRGPFAISCYGVLEACSPNFQECNGWNDKFCKRYCL